MARPRKKREGMSIFAKRIDYLLKDSNISEFERKYGLAKSTIQRIFEGGEPTRPTLEAIIKGTGCNPGWLVAGVGEPFENGQHAGDVSMTSTTIHSSIISFPANARPSASLGEIPTRGLAAADDSQGTRVPDTDEDGDAYTFPARLVMVPVTGDSMSPVVLENQYVFIDAEREGFEKDGGIYVVSILEPEPHDKRSEPIIGTVVKRCYLREDMLYLMSINADYSPFSVYIDHCRLWPVLGTWYDDKGKPPEGF